jgi:hypothetical protein
MIIAVPKHEKAIPTQLPRKRRQFVKFGGGHGLAYTIGMGNVCGDWMAGLSRFEGGFGIIREQVNHPSGDGSAGGSWNAEVIAACGGPAVDTLRCERVCGNACSFRMGGEGVESLRYFPSISGLWTSGTLRGFKNHVPSVWGGACSNSGRRTYLLRISLRLGP